jgi:hydrogenase maturation protein HypF
MLAVGGQLKATFALGRGNQAILSHHLGDLDHLDAFRAFERDIALYQKSFAVDPRVIVHDLHPDYASTRYALRQRDQRNIHCIAVQHHHAHMASCMAEHGLDEPVIGVSFDGTGYGTDGAVWGGEFLVGDLRDYRRAAHLRYVPMPGGERAIKEPWRMALAHLADAGVECPALIERIDPAAVRIARHAIERRINAPLTSSAGRLFDAVASLIGVRDYVTFEGQAAMELQWLAAQRPHRGDQYYELSAFEMSKASSPMLLDTRPIIRAITKELYDGVDAAVIALRFHATLSRMITEVCILLRGQSGIDRVVLSGGVFMNLLLAEWVEKELLACGFFPFRHQRVPPNDGGLSLGQLAVAAKRLAEGSNLGN